MGGETSVPATVPQPAKAVSVPIQGTSLQVTRKGGPFDTTASLSVTFPDIGGLLTTYGDIER